ncbi:MAG: cache domain-containing protein [Xanthobacter sp.]
MLRRLQAVRTRLLVLALLPTLIILPLVLAGVGWWWTQQFDRLLISKVNGDLTIARQYLDRLMEHSRDSLEALGNSVAFAQMVQARDAAVADAPDEENSVTPERTVAQMRHLSAFLAQRRVALGLDFLYLLDPEGRCIAISPPPVVHSDASCARRWPVVTSALDGRATTQIDLFSVEDLSRLSPSLAAQARIDLVPTPGVAPVPHAEEGRGLVVQSGAPVVLPGGGGALVGGVLLNRNLDFIDTINDLVYRRGSLPEGSEGTATVFVDDVRVSTNVRLFEGRRALGTRVSGEVREAVLGQGRVWLDRAFVVNDWYISAYEPVVDSAGRRVGMLYVGFLEAPFLALKRAVLVASGVGFLLVALVTIPLLLRWAAAIFRPLEVMDHTISRVEAGDLEARTGIRHAAGDEIGRLAHHFDALMDLVQQRDAQLRGWAQELDKRVAARTRELEAANAELAATQRRLVMSEKLASIGEITAGVAHEINNPVAVIQGNLDVARDVLGPAMAPVRTEFNLIDQQVHRINIIVSKLLQFARPGEFAGTSEPVHVPDVMGDCLLLVQHLLANAGIEVVRADAATGLVCINRVELQQVLINLMVNAIHAMPQGGTLTLRSHDETRHGRPGVAVEVCDTGKGIAPEHLARLFDPFFTTKGQGGTGLGLSISYSLVEQAEGEMGVESAPGEGARFHLWLPCEERPGAAGL